jgi:hypothetical protein
MQSKKSNAIIKQAQSLRDQGRAELVNLESFTKALNRKPAVIKTNKFANNTQYVPISHIQTLLDTLYFGLWETKNFKYTVIGNEIAASVELWVFHPVIKKWIVRQGAAATQIRMNKGASVMDISQKIKNSVEMDLPHALADCVKSAAKTLGPAFGRDLNRDFVDNYKALVSRHVEANTYNIEEVQEKVKGIDNALDLLNYWDSNKIWQSDADIISIFDEKKREIQGGGF